MLHILRGGRGKLDFVGSNVLYIGGGQGNNPEYLVTYGGDYKQDTRDGVYFGSRPYQPDAELAKILEDQSTAIARFCIDNGYRGFIGCDYIVVSTDNNEKIVYFIEVNERLPISGYAHAACLKLGGTDFVNLNVTLPTSISKMEELLNFIGPYSQGDLNKGVIVPQAKEQ
jgi:hypothetical protein